MGNDNSNNNDEPTKKPDPPEDSTYINRSDDNRGNDQDQDRMIRRTSSNRSSRSNRSNRSHRNNNNNNNNNNNTDITGDVGEEQVYEGNVGNHGGTNNNHNHNGNEQHFSPIRGHMDDSTNFEYTNESHNIYESVMNSSDDLGLHDYTDNHNQHDDLEHQNNSSTNNTKQSKKKHNRQLFRNRSAQSDEDDYDEEEEEHFDTSVLGITTPVNLYTLGQPTSSNNINNNNHNNNNNNNANTNNVRFFGGTSNPDNANSIINNNNNINNINSTRSQSKLLVRHLTRAALLSSEEYDNADIEMSPALKRRLRDFRFAQRKRRERYGEQNPWGIIGLYDHLTGIRTDIEWAEDAAWRRENDQPYLSWQDFEDAKDTGFNQPFFTYFTMAVCTICLVVSIGLNGWKVQPLTENPMIGPSASVLLQMGAKQTSLIVNQNEWYRIFTCMFLHAGIIHFIVNMLALWFIGYAVEQSHGFFAAATLFILPAIGGTLFSALFLPEYISVGASGGIFGLIGACIADIISNWGLLFSKHVNDGNIGQRFRHVKVLIWLVLDIILNIVIGLTPFVDNFTHMGGMFFGFFCGLSTMERLSKAFFGVKTNFMSRLQTFLVRFFGIIFSVLCILAAFIVLASLKDGEMIRCRGCRYISCVPFPFWETEDKWWYCDDCNKPIITAKLFQNTSSLYYTHMNLVCPDNSTVENIALVENTDDQEYFKKNLASYCRQECDVLFSR